VDMAVPNLQQDWNVGCNPFVPWISTPIVHATESVRRCERLELEGKTESAAVVLVTPGIEEIAVAVSTIEMIPRVHHVGQNFGAQCRIVGRYLSRDDLIDI
jgi:hypothetical protein